MLDNDCLRRENAAHEENRRDMLKNIDDINKKAKQELDVLRAEQQKLISKIKILTIKESWKKEF